jgi:hypothetical protein
MGKKSDLSAECQKFVKKLFAFFSKEMQRRSQLSHLIGYIVYQKTSKALGVSYTFFYKYIQDQWELE